MAVISDRPISRPAWFLATTRTKARYLATGIVVSRPFQSREATLNRKPTKLPKDVVYCGSKSIEAGIMNMEELGKCMGGKGNLAILMGALNHEAAIGRTEGIKQVVKEKFPDIKIVREQVANWKRAEGKTVMENWLASGQEIDGVASDNDEMALGALQAIKAAGKPGKICVGGTDASQDATKRVPTERWVKIRSKKSDLCVLNT